MADRRGDPACAAFEQKIAEATLTVAEKDYAKLTVTTAQRTIRFWQVHDTVDR
jgi:hypothetical protein